MAEAYVQEYTFDTPNGQVTLAAVVMDREDFDALVDEIINLKMHQQLTAEHGRKLKELGHIPMIGRGTKTSVLFERYGVNCDKMSVIVRGNGMNVFQKYFGVPNPEDN